MRAGLLATILVVCLALVQADLPVHCLRSDALGKWTLDLSEQSFDDTVDCSTFTPSSQLHLQLSMPNKVQSSSGDVGTWTMVYDEAMEIRLNGKVYTAFFQFAKPDYEKNTMHRSFCGLTWRAQGGSFHDLDGGKWGCFHGAKTTNPNTVTYVSHDGKKHWKACAGSDHADCNTDFEDTDNDSFGSTVAPSKISDTNILSPVARGDSDVEESDSTTNQDDDTTTNTGDDDDAGLTDAQIASVDALLDGLLPADSDDASSSTPADDVSSVVDLEVGESEELYQREEDLVDLINLSQTSYKAKLYPEFDGVKLSDLQKMAGGVPFKQVAEEHAQAAIAEGYALNDLEFGTYDSNFDAGLPESWDWRNVDGENYLFEPTNQGMCGSCFAVATTDMIQTRARIVTKNQLKRKLAVQDILSCGSRYAQGCKGGFPYLASKYTQDYGLTSEKCMPYKAETGSCPREKACYDQDKIHAKNYHYIGGYYGACTPRAMMIEIMNHGPIAIGFQASMSMMHYSSGVFLEVADIDATSRNFFEPTNHAVLAIGWGVDPDTGAKYWIAKNSWGAQWGEHGYFRIQRGKDTAHFESMAVAAYPVIPDDLLTK